MANVQFNADGFFNDLAKDLDKNLKKAAIYLTSKIKSKISRGQPRKRYLGKSVWHKGQAPSQPGEPPKQVTGQLLRSIAWDKIDDLAYAVGSNMKRAAYLEFGTRKQAPRLFLRSTLDEEAAKLLEIVSGQSR